MKTALILEDLPDMQRWHEAVLQEVYPGIVCHKAASVAAAIALIDSHVFDIGLIDLGLPDGSGVDVIRALRNCQEHALSIVVTIFDDNEHLFPALKAGAQGYLLKDQTREQFIQRLRNIASGEPPLSPAISRKLLMHFEALPHPEPEAKLTEREQEVLVLISKGLTLPRVATLLEISRNTTAGYVKAIYRKLNISSRAEAVIEASKYGLLG
jgi:DNA-binding NarL/FixJ family response regulator